jgi:hypothetical protein
MALGRVVVLRFSGDTVTLSNVDLSTLSMDNFEEVAWWRITVDRVESSYQHAASRRDSRATRTLRFRIEGVGI